MSPIIASTNGSSSFTPHPEGTFAAICCDIHDLGMVEVTWQGQTKQQHKVDIYFYCGEMKDGETPLLVRERFTLSLNENSKLRPFLESWRGRKFTAEEERGFDLENLLNAPCFLQVSHNAATNGKTYANIDSVMRLPKGMQTPELPEGFVRPSQRPPREEQSTSSATQQRDVPPPEDDGYRPYPGDGDDLPF